MKVVSYSESHVNAVRRFNQRLEDGGSDHSFPEDPAPEWIPASLDTDVSQKLFVATDGDEVRGGYILKTQPFRLNGSTVRIGNLRYPLSEGIVSARYRAVGLRLIRDAMRRQPFLYGLGMGSDQSPVARLMSSFNWSLLDVPFLFKVLRPFEFLANLQYVNDKPKYRIARDFLLYTGVGGLLRMVGPLKRFMRGGLATTRAEGEKVSSFGPWAGDVWRAGKQQFQLVGRRTASECNPIYDHFSDVDIIKVRKSGDVVGWAATTCTQMFDNKYFGSMRVGSIADGFALPGHEGDVVAAAERHVCTSGAAVVVSNQMSRFWHQALSDQGYFVGPTNFFLSLSPDLADRFEDLDIASRQFHFNRGDGDGPINL
jgi:hypothetical protein